MAVYNKSRREYKQRCDRCRRNIKYSSTGMSLQLMRGSKIFGKHFRIIIMIDRCMYLCI